MRSPGNRLTSLTVVAACILAVAGCGPRAQLVRNADSDLDQHQRAKALESFDFAWQKIADLHYDEDMGGVDWVAVREELRPQILAAESGRQVRAILSDMVSRLGLSHYGIIAGRAYEALDGDDGPRGNGRSGVEIRPSGNQVLVSRVDTGSEAYAKGVRAGWVVRSVDGVDLPPLLEALVEEGRGDVLADVNIALALSRYLEGPVGSQLTLGLLDADDEAVELTVGLERVKGEVATFGNISMRVAHEWKTLSGAQGEVGYFALTSFFDPASVMPAFAEAVEKASDLQGLVLDLRGNLGGIAGMAMGMAGWVVDDKSLYLGTLKTRESELRFVVNPRQGVYGGPLAILVDSMTASTSEILAGGLQDLGRARVFGQRTAGAALPSVVERMPNGDILQYALANYVSASGATLEGTGVRPDEEIPLNRSTLLKSDDTVLEAAIQWLNGQASRGASLRGDGGSR